MTKFIKYTLLIFAFFNLSGCRWFSSASTTYFAWTNFKIPEGTPTFQKGYKDGCSTVLYARGNDYYRTRYSYRYDPTLIGNTEYRFGHQRGYTWCFQNILSAVAGHGTIDRFLFPHGADSMTGGLDYTPKDFNKMGLFGDPDGYSVFGSSVSTTPGGVDSMFGVWQKGTDKDGVGGAGETAFGTNPLWAGGSKGWWLGWSP